MSWAEQDNRHGDELLRGQMRKQLLIRGLNRRLLIPGFNGTRVFAVPSQRFKDVLICPTGSLSQTFTPNIII